tara:strand:+ start:2827 stop:4962 length:2136 start_codon:yes stop_codon:yes gene_type:complete
MDGNIYFLLLILFIFFIVIIITKLKSSKNIQENFQEELIQMKALQDYANIKKSEDLEKLPLITKIDVVKTNKDPKYPNKHLMLEGINLKKIENVYFGPLKGYIINKDNGHLEESENTIKNSGGKEIKYNIIRIIPPDFVKFNKALKPKDYENIEIKLELKDEGLVINNKDIADENSDLKLSENNREYKIKIKNGEFKTIEDKGKILLKFKITSRSDKSIYEFKINGNRYKINKDELIQLKIRNKSNPITFQVLDLGTNETINVKDIKIYNTSDDIEVLFPTGLFYRFDYATSGESLTEKDADSWSVFLNKRINSYAPGSSNKEKDFVLTEDIKSMYKDIQNIITPREVKKDTFNFDVTDLNYEELETTIKIKWKIPKVVNNYIFSFRISIRNSNGIFIYKNEVIPYNKNFYEFPTYKLIAGDKYEYNIQTYRKNKRVGNSDTKKFTFMEDNPDFDSYHSHLFEKGKFNTKLNKNNADLIKTYYHLLEKNKSNMRGNMNNLEEHVSAEGVCIEKKLEELQNTSDDNFDKTIIQHLKPDNEYENLYNEKQINQDNQIEKITQKIKKLEQLQGKLKDNQDTNIKKLTSQNDGTKLSVKKLNNNKFMVGLNQGCISVDKMGNYSNIPCNIFDKKQFFELDSIENDDEYNNLLLMNLQPKLTLEEKVDYPFTVLKPNKLTKCVHIDNKGLQIKPCTDDKSIRYTSHFYNDECKSNI